MASQEQHADHELFLRVLCPEDKEYQHTFHLVVWCRECNTQATELGDPDVEALALMADSMHMVMVEELARYGDHPMGGQ